LSNYTVIFAQWFLVVSAPHIYCHDYYSNRLENMIKVTDCNELKNLAEFYIFIWGDEDIWAIKLYSGRIQIQSFSDSKMMNQGYFTFCQKLFRSNDHFSEIAFGHTNFRSMTIFRKKLSVSVKWTFGRMSFQSFD
jgi:hypothetical protein